MLFQKIQKILNIDIPKTSALKTRMRLRMSKKCGTSADADADIRPIPSLYAGYCCMSIVHAPIENLFSLLYTLSNEYPK